MGACGCFDIRKIKSNYLDEFNNNSIKTIKKSDKFNRDNDEIKKPEKQIINNSNEEILNYEQKIEAEEETDKNNHKSKKSSKNNSITKNNENIDKSILKKDSSLISIYKYPSNFEKIEHDFSNIKGKKEINIILIGEKQSGKSSFVIKVVNNRFENIYIPTVFIENETKILTFNNKKYILNFNVTPGVQEYQEDYSELYSKSNFILLFFDINNHGSFQRAKNFVKKELNNKVLMYPNNYSNICFVANKIDKVPFDESNLYFKSYCEKYNLQYFEISVKTNTGIGYMINKLLSIFEQIST